MNIIEPGISEHIVAGVLAVLIPAAAFAGDKQAKSMDTIKYDTDLKVEMYFGNGLFLWLMTLVVCVVWFFNRPLPLIGFTLPVFDSTIWFLFLFAFVLLYGLDIWNNTRNAKKAAETINHLRTNTPFVPETHHEFQHFIILSLTAGFCEEVIFRGFFIQYALWWTGDSPIGVLIAVLIPGVIFAGAHIYQGLLAVGKIFVLAIAFGYIFLETQSLWIVILLHAGVDVVSGWRALTLLRE